MADLVWNTNDWDENDWSFIGDVDEVLNFMLDSLPHWWNKKARSSEGSNTFEILRAFAVEYATFSDEVVNMRDEVFVDTSTGENLDSLGLFYLLSRKTNETDAAFRGRIKSFRTTFAGGGTADAIETAIAQEFDSAVAVVTDTPGADWATADVTINVSEWVGKIQGSEPAFFSLLDNSKAAGISLRTILTTDSPVFDETFPHGEIVIFGAAQAVTETQSQASDVLTFGVGLDIGGVGDLVWDVNNWDDNNWPSEIFNPQDIFTISIGLPFTETTTMGGEVISIGINFIPIDTMSQGADVLTFGVQLGLTDTNTPTDIVTFGVGLDLPLESISHGETVTEALFLNIPNNMIWDSGDWDLKDWAGDEELSHSEDISFGVAETLSDSMSNSEDIALAFNMIWDTLGSGQESDWDSPNWN